jgi:prephenate dehydratase
MNTCGQEKKKIRVAIQGELGSNSHMAALAMLGDIDIVPCTVSPEVFEAVVNGQVDGAVLPIENSLHGSVAEHYDLLLEQAVKLVRESSLRIRHNLIAAPGVELAEIRHVLSHPVALSQCRRFLRDFAQADALPFYDTAGSVKHVIAAGLRDTAGVAPMLAAEQYGAQVLVAGIEDHAENYTRFHLVVRENDLEHAGLSAQTGEANKMSLAFAVEHRPGSLVAALEKLRGSGADLTKIESRPVPGRPWEYVFYVDLRFHGGAMADAAVSALLPCCGMVKELGRYRAA